MQASNCLLSLSYLYLMELEVWRYNGKEIRDVVNHDYVKIHKLDCADEFLPVGHSDNFNSMACVHQPGYQS